MQVPFQAVTAIQPVPIIHPITGGKQPRTSIAPDLSSDDGDAGYTSYAFFLAAIHAICKDANPPLKRNWEKMANWEHALTKVSHA